MQCSHTDLKPCFQMTWHHNENSMTGKMTPLLTPKSAVINVKLHNCTSLEVQKMVFILDFIFSAIQIRRPHVDLSILYQKESWEVPKIRSIPQWHWLKLGL